MGPAPAGPARRLRPADDTELKLVEAIAAAMWNEIRADRTLTEVMAAIPPLAPAGRTAATCRSPGTRCRSTPPSAT